jgi:hypothetical protein
LDYTLPTLDIAVIIAGISSNGREAGKIQTLVHFVEKVQARVFMIAVTQELI